jgi:hypothetical protein
MIFRCGKIICRLPTFVGNYPTLAAKPLGASKMNAEWIAGRFGAGQKALSQNECAAVGF